MIVRSLAEWPGGRCAKPKLSKMARAHDAGAAKKADEKQLSAWRREVSTRDKGKDRCTGKRVVKTIALDPNRAECHHVAGRADDAVRYDRRNGILLSLATHCQVEENKLRIVGTKFFTVNGKKYIDCDHAVRFIKVRQ